MDRPSAIPSRFGFYLLLLFSFSVSVFPGLAAILAAAATCVWLFQVFIFRDPAPLQSTLFYPVCGLFSFSILTMLISWFFSADNPTVCIGLYSVFYFVAFSFVPSQEKRKMVTWTFLSGVILSLSVRILASLDAASDYTIPGHLPILMVIGFCLTLSLYAEARGIREKLFFGFIFLPIAVAISGVDFAIAVTVTLLLLVIGIAKDRSALVILALMVVVAFSGLFGIEQEFKAVFHQQRLNELIGAPLKSIGEHRDVLDGTRFYGLADDEPGPAVSSDSREAFFISLVRHSGPPFLLFFLWVVFELARRELAMARKIASREEKAYHLAALLTIIVLVVINFHGPWLACSPAILGLWMLMGMTEV